VPDVVVLGAGIAGAAAAYEAVRAGATVTVVDAGFAGRATTAGAGIISPVGLDRVEARGPWVDLVADCVRDYRSLTAEVDRITGGDAVVSRTFAVCGELVVASTDEELARLRELERWIGSERPGGGAATATVERVDAAGAAALFPWLSRDLEALYIPEVGRVDGNRLAAALLDAAERTAPRAVTRTTGIGRIAAGAGRPAASVGDAILEADAVVIAAGAWAGGWATELGIRVGISADAGEIVHLRAGTPSGTAPVVNTFEGSYLVPFEDRIAVGATHERRDDLAAHATAAGLRGVLARALEVAPGLASATYLETRVGLRPASDDGLPLVGPTALDGVSMVGGLGSWGLTLGPTLGAVAMRHALGQAIDPRFEFLSPLRSPIPADDQPDREPSA
jgi:D-amino-acid dehydrogenase